MQNQLPFMAAKMKIPTPRKSFIRRQGLFAKLKNWADYKVIVVQGTAGSGKSTLLASFIQEYPEAGWRWITLDKEDNHPVSFWHYVLQTIKDRLGEQKQPILSLFEGMILRQDITQIVPLLVNALHSEKPLTLVLDDFHHIDEDDLLQSIQLFLKYSPPSLRLVLLSRAEPKLYLGNLTIAGKVLEITERNLKFSAEEANSFLQTTLQLNADQETIYRMNRQSEGWVGGLQLLALASQNKIRPPMGSFRGLNKYVVDYLSNEILSSIHEEERQFLIRTSILNSFHPTLCDQLLGRTDSRKLIRRLLEKNLFLVILDEENELYRYHHLFSAFLRLKFSDLPLDEQRTLRIQAAKIFEQSGDWEESIQHWLEIAHYSEALRLVGKMNQSVTAWRYLSQIPPDHLIFNKEMVFQRLFYHIGNMELNKCKSILDQLEDQLKGDPSWEAFHFFSLLIEDNPAGWEDRIGICELDQMDFSDVTKAILHLTASIVLALRDRYKEALASIEKAMEIESRLRNPYLRYFVLSQKSQIKETLGDLAACKDLYGELFRLVEEHPFLAPLYGNTHIGAVGVSLKMMDLKQAQQHLQLAEKYTDMDQPSMERGYLHNLMEFHLLKGERLEAKKRLQQMASFPIFQNPAFSATLLKYEFYLDNMDPEAAARFVGLYDEQPPRHQGRYEDQMVCSRALWMTGDLKRALETVDQVLEQTRKSKTQFPLIEALLLKVLILDSLKTTPSREILNLLREAIHYGCSSRIFSPFVLEGKKLVPNLRQFIREKEADLLIREKNFVHELLTLIEGNIDPTSLSNREREVLEVMVTGATNREIAERLCISVATVKTHLIHIYTKLHVSNRVEAIEKARRMQLLEPH